MNDMTANKIIKTISQMIDRWEPRISIIDIPIIADEENNTYYIKIIYSIPLFLICTIFSFDKFIYIIPSNFFNCILLFI